MPQEPTQKIDHIESAILEIKTDVSSIKGAVTDHILHVLNDHPGIDLKRSELQEIAKELVKLQTENTDSHEKQDKEN